MKKLICLLLVLPAAFIALACYNRNHVDMEGKSTSRSAPMRDFYSSPDLETAAGFLKRYDLKNIQQYDMTIQSDIAVNLAYLAKYDQALTILRRLQKSYPKDYNIAANLGTTYELVGKNDSALIFIKKGIKINPESHDGSEWVHVKILEAKIKIGKNPDWLSKNRVLNTGVSFSSKPSPNLFDKANDIEYQLQERVPFTPFPDKILANVFDELGDLYATQQSIELAYIAFDFSLQYDRSDPYSVKNKMEQLKPLLRKARIPIPSWRENYSSRQTEKIVKAILDVAVDQLFKKDDVKEGGETTQDVVNTMSAEKQKREKARRNKLWIGGGLTALLLGGSIYLSSRKRKYPEKNPSHTDSKPS